MFRIKRLRAASSGSELDSTPERLTEKRTTTASTTSLCNLKDKNKLLSDRRSISENDNHDPEVERENAKAGNSVLQSGATINSTYCEPFSSHTSLHSVGQISASSKTAVDSDTNEQALKTTSLKRQTLLSSQIASDQLPCIETKPSSGRTKSLKWNKAAKGLYRKLKKGYSCDTLGSTGSGGSNSRMRVFRRQLNVFGSDHQNGSYFIVPNVG